MISLRIADRVALAAALLTLLAGGVATRAIAATVNPSELTSDQLAQVRQLCETNLHLQAGESHFDGCVAGLSESLASVNRANSIRGAREACFKAWPAAGSPDLAECLLDASEGRPGSVTGASGKTYSRTSPQNIRRGEQLACAQLGFDPISGAFQGCLANLGSALDAVDRPSN
jgi:hypothetical protein